MLSKNKSRGIALLVAALSATMGGAGCSASPVSDTLTFTASDPAFAGLDRQVVREVLASRAVRSRFVDEDHESASALLQNIVRNFIACRSALTAYRSWESTGMPPELAPQPRPLHPLSTSRSMDEQIRDFQDDLKSGDVTLLRDALTEQSGCGFWIPALPGNENGPTIADVVNGKASE